MEFAVPPETSSEVSIHDAHSTFGFESVLVGFRKHSAETFYGATICAAKPKIYKWFAGIVIRQGRVNMIQINFVKDEISHIVDTVLAKITPEIGGIFEMTFK